jgi:hypothetical protein
VAQHQTFTASLDTSNVQFTLGGSDHGTHGTFHVKDGMIDFDPPRASLAPSMSLPGEAIAGIRGAIKMTNEVLDATALCGRIVRTAQLPGNHRFHLRLINPPAAIG